MAYYIFLFPHFFPALQLHYNFTTLMSSMSIHVSLKLILSAVSEAKFSPIFEAAFLWYAEYAESKDSKYFLIYHPLNCANVFKYKSRLRCMRNSSIIRIRAHIIPIRILKHPYFICNAASNSTCKKKRWSYKESNRQKYRVCERGNAQW